MNEEKVGAFVKEWIERNRKHLPLNVDSWEIQITKNGPGEPESSLPALGKYNAVLGSMNKFYKHFSRIVELPNYE